MNKIILILVSLSLSACTTYKDADIDRLANSSTVSRASYPALHDGDHVRFVLKNGEQGQMVFRSFTGDTMQGRDGKTVPLNQITSIQKREFSGTKTAAAAGAGAGIAAVTLVAIASAGLAAALIASGSK